jgi:hypothetical protein
MKAKRASATLLHTSRVFNVAAMATAVQFLLRKRIDGLLQPPKQGGPEQTEKESTGS